MILISESRRHVVNMRHHSLPENQKGQHRKTNTGTVAKTDGMLLRIARNLAEPVRRTPGVGVLSGKMAIQAT